MEARAARKTEKARAEKAKKKRMTWSTSEDQILKSASFVHTSTKAVIWAVMTSLNGKNKKQIKERIKKLGLAVMGGTETQSSQEMEIDTQEPSQLETQEPSQNSSSADASSDKWNDARKYVPKSKRVMSEEEEGVTAGRLKKKAKAPVEDEEDDDDLDFGGEVDADGGFTLSQKSAPPAASGTKNLFLDDDDE